MLWPRWSERTHGDHRSPSEYHGGSFGLLPDSFAENPSMFMHIIFLNFCYVPQQKGQLFRESVTGVCRKCITPEEGRMILNDIHSGTCGHHASSRTIVAKAYRAGFYWPHANEMAKEIVDKCEGCQFYSNMSHKLASALKTIPLVWPFAVWGLDMLDL